MMFESHISAGATGKLPEWEEPHATTVAWSYDMEGHARKCVERYCELANKKVEQFFKVSSPCLDDHQFKQEELESVGKLSQVFSQIVLKCLHLARVGRPDILWSVNKLARAVTKWTQACDRRMATFTTQMTTDNIVMWVTRLSIVDWVYAKTQTLLATLRTQNKPREESYGTSVPSVAGVSIPQFYRVWGHFFGCWIAHGWITCSRSVGRGN